MSVASVASTVEGGGRKDGFWDTKWDAMELDNKLKVDFRKQIFYICFFFLHLNKIYFIPPGAGVEGPVPPEHEEAVPPHDGRGHAQPQPQPGAARQGGQEEEEREGADAGL